MKLIKGEFKEISPNCPIQQDLFDVTAEQIEKMKRLD